MSAIIHFYETCYGGFLGLHPPGPSYITVITFKNIWTEKDCAIRRLGKELFRAVIDAAETRGDVLNGAFAGAKEKEMQRMESRGRGSFCRAPCGSFALRLVCRGSRDRTRRSRASRTPREREAIAAQFCVLTCQRPRLSLRPRRALCRTGASPTQDADRVGTAAVSPVVYGAIVF